MRWVQALLAFGAAAVLAAPGAFGASRATEVAAARAWPRGLVVVGYRTQADLARALRHVPAAIVRRVLPLRTAELRPRSDAPAFAAALAREPGIEYVQPLAPRDGQVESALGALPQTAPIEWQFAAAREDAVPDWVRRAARGVTIAVIDTGADLLAPDLAAKAPAAYDIQSRSADVRDLNGHGTFVASLAAASVANGVGVAGFGGDARLLVVRAGRPDGTLTDIDEAAGIVYAVDHGARVINISFGGPDTSATEQRAVDYAVAHDVLLVAAAGNEAEDGNPVEYPAALLQPVGSNGAGSRGLSVGASDASGGRASFSNYGSYLSLAAPGVDVFGAVSALSSPTLYPRAPLEGSSGGLYGYASGTSFSAPEVAGAAALVWGANPALSAPAVAMILEQSASGLGAWTPELGYGVVDAQAAVARAGTSPVVVISGRRVRSRFHLAWAGTGAAYNVSISRDAAAARTALGSTTRLDAWFTLAPGHTYMFSVTALGADGSALASSSPLTVTR